jgi:outer membrane scaffolding protein for murein synthesis (MipA/OmpV family)
MRWLAGATAFVSPAVLAAGIQVDVIPNFIGAGLGVTTEWLGAKGAMATTAISGGAAGGHVTPYASLWVPLSRTVFVGFGGGFTWSSESFMQQRFGVSPEASAASGLAVYSAGADSPIITQRGERDQITAGIGLGYSW